MLFHASISLLALILPVIHAQAPTQLTQDQIDEYTPYTYFAAAAFCSKTKLENWNCGGTVTASERNLLPVTT